jgi:hypothetical protein
LHVVISFGAKCTCGSPVLGAKSIYSQVQAESSGAKSGSVAQVTTTLRGITSRCVIIANARVPTLC